MISVCRITVSLMDRIKKREEKRKGKGRAVIGDSSSEADGSKLLGQSIATAASNCSHGKSLLYTSFSFTPQPQAS